MTSVYEEVEIEDMIYQADDMRFEYPCPCGDKFYISVQELLDGEDIAHCPSCTLKIRVIYDDAVLDKFMPTTASNEEANQAIVSAEEFEKAAVVTEA